MAKIKTSPLELKMLKDAKAKIDMAKIRIENGKKSFAQTMKHNDEALLAAETELNEYLTIQIGKKTDYNDVTFNEDSLEV